MFYFAHERELVAADAFFVDGFDVSGTELTHPGPEDGLWLFGGSEIRDIAGGNFLDREHEVVAAIVENSSSLRIRGKDVSQQLPTGSYLNAIDGGDVDGDGIEEIVGISGTARVVICQADRAQCDSYPSGEGFVGRGITAADINGDGSVEVVALVKNLAGQHFFRAWNVSNGLNELFYHEVDTDYVAIDSADLNGDGIAELVGLQDWFGFPDKDYLHIYRYAAALVRVDQVVVDKDAKDVVLSDLDGDGVAAISLLRDDRSVDMFRWTAPGGAQLLLSKRLPDWQGDAVSKVHLTAADIDGDSPKGLLSSSEPELIPGKLVPIVAYNFPPYSSQHSAGETSWLWIGRGETDIETVTNTVSLHLGMDIGVSAELAGIGAKVSRFVGTEVGRRETHSKRTFVGRRYSARPNPDLFGRENYGGVVLSAGCFHGYKYKVVDPTGAFGGGGGQFVVIVPVGGVDTVWSTRRYNALAEALGTMPKITVQHMVGVPESYPATPKSMLDGTAISANSMLFPDPPTMRTSDINSVAFSLSARETNAIETNLRRHLSTSGSVSVPGFSFDMSIWESSTTAYQVSVGTDVSFVGGSPAIPDDPRTPEDEYAAHSFAFRPYVYVQSYETDGGDSGSFYVLDYVVTQ